MFGYDRPSRTYSRLVHRSCRKTIVVHKQMNNFLQGEGNGLRHFVRRVFYVSLNSKRCVVNGLSEGKLTIQLSFGSCPEHLLLLNETVCIQERTEAHKTSNRPTLKTSSCKVKFAEVLSIPILHPMTHPFLSILSPPPWNMEITRFCVIFTYSSNFRDPLSLPHNI